jgi:alkylmercury lyase
MTAETDQARRLVDLVHDQFGLLDLPFHVGRLLAEGEPVAVAEVAAAGGWTEAEVSAELARHPGVDWDEDGRIVGFGLTLRTTPHSFTFDGRTLYTFCASDALEASVMLGQPGVIDSTCPATGAPIRVELTPDRLLSVDPAGAVVSKVRPDRAVADLRAEVCALGSFFGSREAASGWIESNPQGVVVAIAEDFAVTRLAMTQLGWTPVGRE